MPYFTTSDEWQRQSTLLLQARPTTTRITTKYHIPNLSSPRHEKKLAKRSQKTKDDAQAQAAQGQTPVAAPKAARAYIELKTYDPESGTVLKYKTDKAAEVGRLIGGLGRLGRPMAGLEVREEDVEMRDAAATTTTTTAAAEGSGTATPLAQAEPGAPVGEASAVQQKAQQNAQQGGQGKNKKKKGKR